MRGSAEIPVMKGFEDGFVVKANDGHESDTMPPDPGADVTDKTDTDFEKAGEGKDAANIKAGDNKKGSASTTMADDTAEVAEEAEKPIDEGYVQDIQGEKVSDGGEVEKGWESYNEKCASGIVVKDYGLNKHNVTDAYDQMQAAVDAEFVEKGPKWEAVKAGARRGAEYVSGGVKRGAGATYMAGGKVADATHAGAKAAGRGAKRGAAGVAAGATYVGGKAKSGGKYAYGKGKAGAKRGAAGVAAGGRYVGRKGKAAGKKVWKEKKRYGAGAAAGLGIGAGGTYAATRKKK